MEIKSYQRKVLKTAHYSTYGELSDQTKYFWFALHGSHMLCEQMLYKFNDFDPKEHFILAPEGLSRFYLKGFSGDVVATWMTKQDRLVEIEDFSVYLNDLYTDYTSRIPTHAKKIIFGFSQGGTSAFRWMYNYQVQVDHILAYSTWIPEDLDFSQSQTDITKIPINYTIGLQDEYMNDERMNFLKQIVKRNKFQCSYELYEGNHRISKHQLSFLFRKYYQD